jgi:hypothetical protein
MTAAERVVDLYRRHAVARAAARGTSFAERAWIGRFAELRSPGAAGARYRLRSGQPIAVYLASSGHPVTGIGSSPELIALFHGNLATTAAEVADMRSLSLGTRFDGLIVWDGFFHLAPDEQRPFPRPCLAGCTAAVHQRP